MSVALVVEDSRVSRKLIRRMLEELSFEVVEAADGAEALVRLAELSVDVVLLDWTMPNVDGLEFVRRARELPALRELPILMVTSKTDLARVATALEAGADEYLMKPFTRDALLDKLALVSALKGRSWDLRTKG